MSAFEVLFSNLFFCIDICPYFDLILIKHKLNPTNEYGITTQSIASESSDIVKDISISIKYLPSDDFKEIPMNKERTNFFNQILNQNISKEKRESMKGKFQIPNFMTSSDR